jgi:hypothetical protein
MGLLHGEGTMFLSYVMEDTRAAARSLDFFGFKTLVWRYGRRLQEQVWFISNFHGQISTCNVRHR